jgi:5-methyltetrahydrofolate--homocysteine methyltransferase
VRLHERVRKTLWGCAPDEALTNDDLVREKYRAWRRATPPCTDHVGEKAGARATRIR